MSSTKDIITNLLNALLPHRSAPMLGKVIKANEGPGESAYSVDVKVLAAGSLEETEMLMSDVPISPIWVGDKGKGLYAIPPTGTVVIIEFINWDVAFPYISGIWSNDYEAGTFGAGQLIITDGDGLRLGVDVDSLILFETKNKSLKSLLEALIDKIIALQTVGPPPQHVVSPASIQEFTTLKTEIAKLLK